MEYALVFLLLFDVAKKADNDVTFTSAKKKCRSRSLRT
jgi:hypothetical protein